jgi:hypothetical protein
MVDTIFGADHNQFNTYCPDAYAKSGDRAFIDQVHERDEREMIAGHINSTHMLAVVGNGPKTPTLFSGLAPEFCVRPARESDRASSSPSDLRSEIFG